MNIKKFNRNKSNIWIVRDISKAVIIGGEYPLHYIEMTVLADEVIAGTRILNVYLSFDKNAAACDEVERIIYQKMRGHAAVTFTNLGIFGFFGNYYGIADSFEIVPPSARDEECGGEVSRNE